MGAGDLILFLLAAVCWLGMLATFPTFVGNEVHGDAVMGVAMIHIAAFALAAITWLSIGGLLLRAGTRGLLPAPGNLAALVLGPASAAAVMSALYLLTDPGTRWPAAIPAVAPVLLAGYVFGLMQPTLRPFFSTPAAARSVWLLALVLAVAPAPAILAEVRRELAQRAAHAGPWQVRAGEFDRAQNLKKLHAMPRGAPIADWYPLLTVESGVQAEALAVLRGDPTRQAQIEDMLSWGIRRALTLLPDLDLQATPELCRKANALLIEAAGSYRRNPDDLPVRFMPDNGLNEYVPTVRWLLAHGWNCDEAIATLDAAVQSYGDSRERRKTLADLARLRPH
jgi:hypothetical protein